MCTVKQVLKIQTIKQAPVYHLPGCLNNQKAAWLLYLVTGTQCLLKVFLRFLQNSWVQSPG